MIFGNQIHFKKKNKAEILKAPSVLKITTRISIADGLILLLYSIKHYESYAILILLFTSKESTFQCGGDTFLL